MEVAAVPFVGGTEPAVKGRICRVGVISDTHGRLDDEVLKVFAGVDRILHAGDVGDERVLARLALVAHVTAVSGNMDAGHPTGELGSEAVLDLGGVRLLVGHIKGALLRRHGLAQEAIGVVVTGHTHRPEVTTRDGVLFVNPGTANRSLAFGRPATVALLEVDGGKVSARIVTL